MKLIRLTLRIMWNETYKRLLILWDYKFNAISQLLVIALIFLGATFFLHLGTQQLPAQFLGYIIWIYARLVLISTGTDMMGEAQAGTLEQMYMSPVRSELLMLGRILALLLSTTLMVLLIIVPLSLLMHIDIPLHWLSIPVLLLTLCGIAGFTLILSGCALLFKQIDSLADMSQNLLLFLTGTIVPISTFPGWLAILARALPTTQGIIVLREVTLSGQSLHGIWQSGELPLLLLLSLLYLGIGWLVFKRCEHMARQRGSLGQY